MYAARGTVAAACTVQRMASDDRGRRTTVALPRLDAPARTRAQELGWHVDLLDPLDADERSVLIRLAHPELDQAIEAGEETVVVDAEPMNPRLHLAIHEFVATQIIDGEPPEAFASAERLLALGRDHHEVLHMLGFCVSGQLWAALHDRREYSREEHVRALGALPGSFDREFARPAGNRAARRAAARRARRRR
jgi:hypothetical protein